MALRTRTWCLISLGLFVASGLMWKMGDYWQGRKAPTPAVVPAVTATNRTISLLTRPEMLTNANRAVARETLRLRNTAKRVDQLTRLDTAILLRNAFIDTASKEPLRIPRELRADGPPGAYVAQARGAIGPGFRKSLAAAGARIVSYIPNNAFLVEVTESGAKQLAGDAAVQSVLPYEPYYKLEEKLLGLAVSNQPLAEASLLRVTLFPGQRESGRQAVSGTGAEILDETTSSFGALLTVKPDAANWVALARLPAVQGIEPKYRRAPMLDLSRPRLGVAADSVATNNYLDLTGSNVMVSLNDSGVDATHPALKGRVFGVDATALLDTVGHGTHVAGIIAGDGAKSDTVTNAPGSVSGASYRGIAPGARLFVIPLDLATGPSSDTYLAATAAKTNATISNNSWGYPSADTYDSSAAAYDAAVRDALPEVTGSQPVTFVFAAGNSGAGAEDGTGGEPGTINSPGTAKNVITVGSLEQPRNITNEVVTQDDTGAYQTNQAFVASSDSEDQVVAGSSRGNVSPGTEGLNGRFKPDVVAPGEFVVSARSAQWKLDLHPTKTVRNHYDKQEIAPGALNPYLIFIPPNAVQVQIILNWEGGSTNTLPSLPIYAKFGGFAAANDYNATAVGQLALPADGALSTDADLYYAVGNVGADFVAYGITTLLTLTNSDGTYYEVFKQLDDGLGPYYRFESGTSMAAPAVSGMLALMKEFFEQRMPAARRHTNSPALMKALLINGARSVSTRYDLQVQTTLNLQGWGLPNISNSVPAFLTNAVTDGAPLQFFDQSISNAVATGERRTWKLALDPAASAAPLRATLVWTDPPGNPNAGVKLVNDLDLVITNMDTGDVYWGNDIAQGGDYNSTHTTNDPPVSDVINNVENVFINMPFTSGTNFTVTVIGRHVNVNALTADPTRVAQDYALVISSADYSVTNAFTLTVADAPAIELYSTTPLTNAMPLLEQHVGANSPLIGQGYGTTNQWRFYVFTNSMDTNAPILLTNGPNVAFITFLTPNLGIPRTNEADIDLYVSTNSALTNLDAAAITNADKSVKRGGNELVFYTNAPLGQVYYLGVKSEDQQAAEFGLISLSSDHPFDEATANGGRLLHGIPVNVMIPDGSPQKPGFGMMFAIGTVPITVGRVVVTNVIAHQNLGDLVGNLSHDGQFVVLNNHSLNNGHYQGTNLFIYDDSNNGDIFYSRPTDGPGNLGRFSGGVAYGTWMLDMIDDSLGQTGMVMNMEIRIDPQPPLGGLVGEVLANSFTYYTVDVPVEATNMNVFVWDIKPSLPLNVYVRRADAPTLTVYDKKALIDPNLQNLSNSVPVLALGKGDVPPLEPGRYYIGVYNPNAVTVKFRIDAKLDYDLSGSLAHAFNSGSTPTPVGDDRRMYSTNYVDIDRPIVALNVGVRIDHPRPSDLVLHLISPQGTSVLLAEDRGGTSTGGFGAGATNTGVSYFTFTENTNLTTTPVKFAATPFTSGLSVTTNLSDGFETYTVRYYVAGQSLGNVWSVTTNRVEEVNVDSALRLEGVKALNMHNGTVTRSVPTTAGHQYVASISYRRSPPMPGAVSWWPFEGTVNGALDITNGAKDFLDGNNADLTLFPTRFDVGKVDAGLVFQGVDKYVRVPAATNLSTPSFTWEGWIKPGDASLASPIFGFSGKVVQGVNLWMTNNGRLLANIVDRTGAEHVLASDPNVLVAGNWYHLALTFDQTSGAAKIYVAGKSVASATFAGITPQTTNNLYFGYYPAMPGGDRYKGMMDEVVWYNRALPAQEIAEIAQSDANGHDLTGYPPAGSTNFNAVFMIAGVVTNALHPTTGWQKSAITFTASDAQTAVVIASAAGGFLVDAFALTESSGQGYFLAEETLDAFKQEPGLGNWVLQIDDTRVGATTGPTPMLVSWQLQIIFATPAHDAIFLTNAIPYVGTVEGNDIRYFIVETPRVASFATNLLQVLNTTGDLILLGDRAGLPTGDSSLDDYTVGPNGPGQGEYLLLSTNSPLLAPLLPGTRYYLGVKNKNPNETNEFAIMVTFDRVDPTNYVSVPTLTNGVPVTNTIASGPALDYYQYIVSSNGVSAQFSLYPSNGNVNLVVRRWRPVEDPLPNTTRYDYSSSQPGTLTDQITIVTNSTPVPLAAGIWYVGVANLESFPVTYTLVVHERIVRIIDLTNGVPLLFTNYPGAVEEDYFRFRISDTNASAWFDLENLSGNADLALKLGGAPTRTSMDAGRFGGAGDKEITLTTNGTPATTSIIDTNELNLQYTVVSNHLVLSWNTLPGAAYRVQGKTNIIDAVWDDVAASLPAIDTNTTYAIDLLTTPYHFFNVVSVIGVPGDLVLPDLNGDWYLAVFNNESKPVSFTLLAASPPDFIPLTNGITATNTLQPSPYAKYYSFEVATNDTMAFFEATPLNGDIAFYARKANTNRVFWPTPAAFDAGSDNPGALSEQIFLLTNSMPVALTAGTWYLGVYNVSAGNVDFAITAYGLTNLPLPRLTNGVASTNLLGTNLMDFYWFTVSTNAYKALFETFNADGNVDLYARRGLPFPGPGLYDYAGTNGGTTNETITILTNALPVPLTPGIWLVGVSNADVKPVAYGIRGTEFVPATTNTSVDNLHVSVSNGWFYISWASTIGSTYRVDGCSNIVAPVWTTVVANFAATNALTTVRVAVSAGYQFFNVVEIGGTPVTPPTGTNAVTNLTWSVSNGLFTISWASTVGSTYRLDSGSNIIAPVWSTVVANFTATNTLSTVRVPVSAGFHFFRVLEIGGTPVTPPSTNNPPDLTFNLVKTNNSLVITWNATVGATYRVEGNTNLGVAAWYSVSGDIKATHTVMTYAVPTSGTGVFLRVVVVAGGTTPTAQAPSLNAATSDLATNGFVLRWTASAGQKFTVQYSDDLKTWNTFTGVVTPVNGSCQYTDASAPPPGAANRTRYYRVVVVP